MKKGELLVYSISVVLFIFISLWFSVEFKIALTFSFLNLLIISHMLYKEKVDREILVAFLFALFVTSYHRYEYTTVNLFIGRINLFPLTSWVVGLVVLREVYKKIKIRWPKALVLSSLLYLFVLFSLEYLGYHFLGIQLNSSYPSLLNLGVIHAPIVLKFFYICAGPPYLITCNYLFKDDKDKKNNSK